MAPKNKTATKTHPTLPRNSSLKNENVNPNERCATCKSSGDDDQMTSSSPKKFAHRGADQNAAAPLPVKGDDGWTVESLAATASPTFHTKLGEADTDVAANQNPDHTILQQKSTLTEVLTNPEKTFTIKLEPETLHQYTIKIESELAGQHSKKVTSAIFEQAIDPMLRSKCRVLTSQGNRNLRLAFESLGTVEDTEFSPEVIVSTDDAEKDRPNWQYVCWEPLGRPSDYVRFSGLTAYQKSNPVKISFEHRSAKISELPASGLSRHIINTFIGAKLKSVLQTQDTLLVDPNPFADGSRVFYKKLSHRHGLIEMAGISARLVYGKEGNPTLDGQRLTAHFYREILVSDLLLKFFGPSAANGFFDESLDRPRSLLKGLKILVATSKEQTKKVFTINGLSSDSGDRRKSLTDTFGRTHLQELKYPNMPCINVGSDEKPNFFPAEYCRIHGGEQYLRGALPHSVPERAFHKTVPKEWVEPPQMSAEIFTNGDASGFGLTFVTLREEEFWDKKSFAVSKHAMASLKKEIGLRYNGVLSDTVQKSQALVTIADKIRSEFLKLRANKWSGVKHALVVAVSKSLPVTVVDNIRKTCDLEFGVQCCIVSGKEVMSRYDPVSPRMMVMYTGQLVRKMFARAKIPGNTDKDKPRMASRDLGSTDVSRIVGIHVACASEFRGKDEVDGTPVLKDHCYFASIVSVVRNSEGEKPTMNTSVYPFFARSAAAMNTSIVDCLKQHHVADTPLEPFRHTYISGLSHHSLDDLEILVNQISRCFKSQEGEFPSRLTTFTPEPTFHLSDDSICRILSSNDPGTYGTHIPIPFAVQKVHELHEQLANETEEIFNFESRCGNGVSGSVNRVTDSSSRESEVSATFRHLVYLTGRRTPPILYLAQQAARRARLRVFLKDADKAAQHPASPYALAPVHKDLKDSLYFLS